MVTGNNTLFETIPEEMVIEIEIERLRDFHGHPFKVRDDDQMKNLRVSIEKYGILTPLIVRPVPEGCYEIISGHRRKYIAKYLGFRKVPVIIRVMKDDEAVIAMLNAKDHAVCILPTGSGKSLIYYLSDSNIYRVIV